MIKVWTALIAALSLLGAGCATRAVADSQSATDADAAGCAWNVAESDHEALKPGAVKGRPLAFAVGISVDWEASNGCLAQSAEYYHWRLPVHIGEAHSSALKVELADLPAGSEISYQVAGASTQWQDAASLPKTWYTPHVPGQFSELELRWPKPLAPELSISIPAAFRGDF